jgi:hypothetical protein
MFLFRIRTRLGILSNFIINIIFLQPVKIDFLIICLDSSREEHGTQVWRKSFGKCESIKFFKNYSRINTTFYLLVSNFYTNPGFMNTNLYMKWSFISFIIVSRMKTNFRKKIRLIIMRMKILLYWKWMIWCVASLH